MGGVSRRGGGGPHLVFALLFAAFGCGGLRGVNVDPKEHVRGEHHRLIHESAERLWPRVVQALEDDAIGVARADRARGTIETRRVRHDERDVAKRIRDIADLSEARAEGLGGVSEYRVAYRLFVVPVGADTSLKITSTIEAVTASEPTFVGVGVLQIIPRHIEVPSRGVVERDLMRRLAASLFTAEEMLLVLGEPGLD